MESKEELLAEFYRARQKDDESVTTWSCRLEDLLGKAVTKRLVKNSDKDGMLRSMLWTGLKSSLKDISGYKYDTLKTFDELRVALRHIEKDYEERTATTKKPQIAKSATKEQDEPKPDTSKLDELTGLVLQLATRMDSYETNSYGNRGRGGNRYRGNKKYQSRPNWQNRQDNRDQASSANQTKEIRCYRCGQVGHIKKGCRVRQEDLNSKKPLNQDRQ